MTNQTSLSGQDGINPEQGASDKSDRATAAEPKVSALRDGIPSAHGLFNTSEEELNKGARLRFDSFGKFNIDRWPASVAAQSMPTKFIQIDEPEAFLSLYDCPEGWQESASMYAAKIDEAIGWDQHFFKLNSRSPKDASYPVAPVTISGKQAISWTLQSERCLDDIVTMWRAREPIYFCLREWRCLPKDSELRCFASGGQVKGVSRYDYRDQPTHFWPSEKVLDAANRFYEDHLAAYYEDVVFDLGMMGDEPLLIELNPYGLSDPCCFGSYETIETIGGFALTAQGMEAAKADETGTGSAVGDSPVGPADASKPAPDINIGEHHVAG